MVDPKYPDIHAHTSALKLLAVFAFWWFNVGCAMIVDRLYCNWRNKRERERAEADRRR